MCKKKKKKKKENSNNQKHTHTLITDQVPVVSPWAKDSFHSSCSYNEFCRYIECRYKVGWLYFKYNVTDRTWRTLGASDNVMQFLLHSASL